MQKTLHIHRRTLLQSSVCAFASVLAGPVAWAHGDRAHAPAAAAGPVRQEQQAWGIAGTAAQVRRTVTVRMTDAMRFEPAHLNVRQGDTLRLVLVNSGQMLHEFVLGTPQELAAHAELMKKFPNMEHDAPYMAHVPAGQRGEIIWTFNRAGTFQFACLLPGHYEAGMVGTVKVSPSTPA
jgi:uncharacterized cupredoxin-like copper-binding protein